MRSMAILGATVSMGRTKSASFLASSGESFTPAMRVMAIIIVRVLMAGRVARAAVSPSRSSAVECLVEGTRNFLISSSAACKDQASVPIDYSVKAYWHSI